MVKQVNKGPGGHFHLEQWRDGKLIATRDVHNDVTTQGMNYLLDCGFGGNSISQLANWYIGLINNSPTPTLLAADTLASHTGWVELVPGTDYTGDRQAWTIGAAASGVKVSSSVTSFSILTTKTVYGILMASAATGTSGTLWSTAQFVDGSNNPAPMAFVNGDTLKVSYSYAL